MWDDVGRLWDLDPHVRHLNHGSYGAAPRPVLEEQARWIRRAQANPNRFFRTELDSALAAVRERAAAFLSVPATELYLLTNPTTAMAAVLRSVGIGRGDSVLLTDSAYPGVVAAAAATGAAVETWSTAGDAGELVAVFREALARFRPRLAVAEHVAFATGRVLPVTELAAAARDAGRPFCVDGAHAPGALDLDVGAVGADYYAGSFHKWCCAPPGAGFLHARGAVGAPIPGAREKAGPPASIEWSGTHDFSPLLALPAALVLLEDLGLSRIREQQRSLLRHAAALFGLSTAAGDHPGLLAIPLNGAGDAEATALVDEASKAGLEIAVTPVAEGWAVRASAFVYNRPADYDALAGWLRAR